MNENLLIPLPQEGLQVFDDASGGAVVKNAPKELQASDRGQWELDGLNQTMSEDDSILADLERFSALLREPPRSTYIRKSIYPVETTIRRRPRHEVVTPDPEDIKRTSSLYDITYVEVDPDEITEGAEAAAPPDRLSQSMIVHPTSASSGTSATSRRAESSPTESSVLLPDGVEKIAAGRVPDLMRYLDRIPESNSELIDGASVEARFAACVQRFDAQKEREVDLEMNKKARCTEGQVDSGITSVDSALMKTSPAPDPESSAINLASFYPGNFLP